MNHHKRLEENQFHGLKGERAFQSERVTRIYKLLEQMRDECMSMTEEELANCAVGTFITIRVPGFSPIPNADGSLSQTQYVGHRDLFNFGIAHLQADWIEATK